MTMTDDLRARLEEDQRIIEDATGGPWEVLKERVVTEDMDLVTPRLHSEPEAVFIAASRTRWEQSNRALLAVLEMHSPVGIGAYDTVCGHCSKQLPSGHFYGKVKEWPCPTVKAIQEAMGDG